MVRPKPDTTYVLFLSDSLGKQHRPNPFQLPEVQKVVAGIQPPHLFEALLTTLAVDSHPDQIDGAQVLPDPQVGVTKRDKLLECVADFDVAVVEPARPE